MPMESVDTLKTAAPALTGAAPSTVAPSENVTVPVAAPPLVVIAAVKVTLPPYMLGFTLEDSVTLLVAICTVCVSVGEVLPLSFASPA